MGVLSMMVRGGRLCRSRAPLKEVLLLLLLLKFVWRFGIHLPHLHFLALRERREMANERNQFPAVEVIVPGRAERGHSAEHDAVLDSVVELAVRHVLRFFAAHI